MHEYPNYRENNSCKEHNYRTDNAVNKLEVEYDNANDRRDNIGVADNDEATMIDKIMINI